MHPAIPQWITQAFVRSAVAAGATAPREELEECAARLLDIWSAPERHFHDVRHLADMLARIDTLAPETQEAHLARLAAWGHGLVFNIEDDAVYSRNGGEDEKASAEVSSTIYATIGIPSETIERIAKLIRGLRKRHDVDAYQQRADETARFAAIDVDRLALYDAHFATLAADPQRYKNYTESVRAEYSHVPEHAWLEARREIVSHLLGRKRIFLTPLAAEWEAPARQNLNAELGRIDAKLGASVAPVGGETDESPGSPELSESADYSDLETTSDSTARIVETAELERIHAGDRAEAGVADIELAGKHAARADRLAADPYEFSGRSSLEHLDDIFDPGAPPRVLTHDQREVARREQISQDTIDAIEERRRETDERD